MAYVIGNLLFLSETWIEFSASGLGPDLALSCWQAF